MSKREFEKPFVGLVKTSSITNLLEIEISVAAASQQWGQHLQSSLLFVNLSQRNQGQAPTCVEREQIVGAQ